MSHTFKRYKTAATLKKAMMIIVIAYILILNASDIYASSGNGSGGGNGSKTGEGHNGSHNSNDDGMANEHPLTPKQEKAMLIFSSHCRFTAWLKYHLMLF